MCTNHKGTIEQIALHCTQDKVHNKYMYNIINQMWNERKNTTQKGFLYSIHLCTNSHNGPDASRELVSMNALFPLRHGRVNVQTGPTKQTEHQHNANNKTTLCLVWENKQAGKQAWHIISFKSCFFFFAFFFIVYKVTVAFQHLSHWVCSDSWNSFYICTVARSFT